MDPFRKALTEVIRGYEESQPESLPSWSCLRFLTGFLANQSKKLTAINEGLVTSCFEAYDAYRQLMAEGTAWDEAEELKTLGMPPAVPGVPGTTDLTCQCRQEILKILHSLIVALPAREIVYSDFGIDRLTAPLSDPHPLVRLEACDLITTFATFPDALEPMSNSLRLYQSISELVLHDPDSKVVSASIAALAKLTGFPRALPLTTNRRELIEAVIIKLVNIVATLTRFVDLNEVPSLPITAADADCCVGLGLPENEATVPYAVAGGDAIENLAASATAILKSTSHIMKPDAFPREKVPKRTLAPEFNGVPIATTISAALTTLSNLACIAPLPSALEQDDNKNVPEEDPTRDFREAIVSAGAISALTPLLRAQLSAIRLGAAALAQHLLTTPLGKGVAADPTHEDLIVLDWTLPRVARCSHRIGSCTEEGRGRQTSSCS